MWTYVFYFVASIFVLFSLYVLRLVIKGFSLIEEHLRDPKNSRFTRHHEGNHTPRSWVCLHDPEYGPSNVDALEKYFPTLTDWAEKRARKHRNDYHKRKNNYSTMPDAHEKNRPGQATILTDEEGIEDLMRGDFSKYLPKTQALIDQVRKEHGGNVPGTEITRQAQQAPEKSCSNSFAKNLFAGMATASKLTKDTYVEIHNLTGRPELNGLVGQIRGYVKEKDRYAVEIDPTSSANGAVLMQRRVAQTYAIGAALDAGTLKTPADVAPLDAPPISFSSTSRFSLQRKNLAEIDIPLEKWTKKATRKWKKQVMKNSTSRKMQGKTYDKRFYSNYLDPDDDESQSSDQEDETSESGDASDGSLAEAKVRDYPAARRRNGFYNTCEGEPGVLKTNPAYKYPKTGTRPVLVLAGFGQCDDVDGSNFMVNVILSQFEEKWKEWGCRFLSFKHGKSGKAARKIVDAIESGEYKSIVIGDLSSYYDDVFDKFNECLGPSLRTFVLEFGGSVAFVSHTGDSMLRDVLLEIYPEIGWRKSCYYRATHCAVQRNRENVKRLFPGAEDDKFSVKGNMLGNVPDNEIYFATSQDLKLFRGDDYDASKDKDANRQHAIVAVKQFPVVAGNNKTACGGKVAYFGDINGEADQGDLVVRFLDTQAIATV
ncbi:unnamed protein product [Amoebophrya sp. A120]|nr:unnamed protein product [Amoebophrya sp. A120]|eukprot:GSA120T00005376001.1